MKRHDTKIDGRVSFELRALVEQGGERSASLRALLIIGGATCGLDLTDVREEIPDLISSRLQPAVRASLLALIREPVAQPLLLTHSQEPADEEIEMEEEAVLGDGDGAGFDV